jgi:galactose mutarotase-like enzyme
MEVIDIYNDNTSASIALSVGNNLFSLKVKDKELLYFPYKIDDYSNNNKLAGNPIMHPWVNRIQGHQYSWQGKNISLAPFKKFLYYDAFLQPLHGLLLKSALWNVVEKGVDYLKTTFYWDESLPYFSAFPFAHTIIITYRLINNGIDIHQQITNHSSITMPLSTGFHPYFIYDYNKRNNIKFNLGFSKYFLTDEHLIPTGELADTIHLFPQGKVSLDTLDLDHGFVSANSEIIVELPTYMLKLYGEGFPYWVVYTPHHKDKPYFCIEPITSPTNGFNLYHKMPDQVTLAQISPDSSYETKFTICAETY